MVAIALDPRTKTLSHIPNEEHENVWKTLRRYTLAYYEKFPPPPPSSSFQITNESKVNENEKKKEEDDDDFLSFLNNSSYNNNNSDDNFETRLNFELSEWQQQPALAIRQKIDGKLVYNCPYKHWNEMKRFYPLLAQIAQKVCCCFFSFSFFFTFLSLLSLLFSPQIYLWLCIVPTLYVYSCFFFFFFTTHLFFFFKNYFLGVDGKKDFDFE